MTNKSYLGDTGHGLEKSSHNLIIFSGGKLYINGTWVLGKHGT